ncbi:TPA: hypothetical protein KLE27_004624, partial [Shigella sonnei]|nr:hypothetical protein [Shigella sonnei]
FGTEMTLEEMLELSLVAAQCGSDSFADKRFQDAYLDLTISVNVTDQYLKIFRERGTSLNEKALQEQQSNRSSVMSNLARAAAILGKPEAESYAKHALHLASTLTDVLTRTRRIANAYAAHATVCQLSGHISDAREWAI